MKLRMIVRVSVLGAALVSAFLLGTWAQTQTQSPILKWPLALEAVHAAPSIHHILFENDSVRLLEVTVQPTQRTRDPGNTRMPIGHSRNAAPCPFKRRIA